MQFTVVILSGLLNVFAAARSCYSETRDFSNSSLLEGDWVERPHRLYSETFFSRDANPSDACLRTLDFSEYASRRNWHYGCREGGSQGTNFGSLEPRGCSLPRVHDSLRELDEAKARLPLDVTFIGDSLSRESFFSAFAQLRQGRHAGTAAAANLRPAQAHVSCMREDISVANVSWGVRASFPAHRLSIGFWFTNNLAGGYEAWSRDGAQRGRVVRVAVFNTGAWAPASAHARVARLVASVRRAARPAASWVPARAGADGEARELLLYRQTFAADFPTSTGEYEGRRWARCRPRTAPPLRCEDNPACARERALFEQLREAGFAILGTWDASAAGMARRHHVANWSRVVPRQNVTDCLHFCLPGPIDSMVTQPLFAMLASAVAGTVP